VTPTLEKEKRFACIFLGLERLGVGCKKVVNMSQKTSASPESEHKHAFCVKYDM
jgi:hypothetical protein